MTCDNPTSVRELDRLNDDTPVDFLVGTLTKCDTKEGKFGPYYNICLTDLTDKQARVYGNAFLKADPSWALGQPVVIEGAVKGSYNQKTQIAVKGKGCAISHYLPEGNQAAPAPTSNVSRPVSASKPNQPSPSTPQHAAPSQTQRNGQTVGMSWNKAVDLWINANPGKIPNDDAFIQIQGWAFTIETRSQALPAETDDSDQIPF